LLRMQGQIQGPKDQRSCYVLTRLEIQGNYYSGPFSLAIEYFLFFSKRKFYVGKITALKMF
jgi:hypothetical protein